MNIVFQVSLLNIAYNNLAFDKGRTLIKLIMFNLLR